MEFGKHLVELRKENQLSQEMLAELIGVSRQAISKWERDEALPDLYNMKKLSEVFKMSIDDLIAFDYKETLEHSEEKSKDNHLSKILTGVPSFIFGMLYIYGLISLVIAVFVFIGYLFKEEPYPLNANIGMIVVFGSIPIAHLFVYLYKNLFTNSRLKLTKTLYIIALGYMIIIYLFILFMEDISGFAMIFLYIIGLVVLLVGLVGAILIDIDSQEVIHQKINITYLKLFKYIKWLYIVVLALLAGTVIKDHLLLKRVSTLDSIIIDGFTQEADSETTLVIDLLSRDQEGYYNVGIDFLYELEQNYDGAASVELIVDGNVIHQGDMRYNSLSDLVYSYYETDVEFPLNIDYFKEHDVFTLNYSITISTDLGQVIISGALNGYTSEMVYKTDYVWFWKNDISQ
ncbi:MAG: helix-turn-helix transcriptional regulator [Sphaerochaetaceae bacterium]|nr:helix-turn-helix transcriptional regulator [Sphaerochaetaceae bacterium]